MAAKCAGKISVVCLLLGTFIICSFPGLVSSQVPKTPTILLNKILGESALLPVHITSANTVSIVKWIFHPRKGEANDLGRFSDGKWVRWNMSDNFGQRLETVDGSMLKISNLVVKDSGVYKAHVTFSTGVTETHTFGLTVYGKRAFWFILWPFQHHQISIPVISIILLVFLGVFLYRKINKTSDPKGISLASVRKSCRIRLPVGHDAIRTGDSSAEETPAL